MIKILRVDDRLIHGQVAVAWSKVLNISHIVLVDEEVVKNELQKMTLKMAVPQGIKFIASNTEDGIKLLKDPRTKKLKIMIVVRDLGIALKLAENLPDIEVINLGNYGMVARKGANPKKPLLKTVRVDDEDIKILEKIAKLGLPFEAQLTPDSAKKNVLSLLKGE